MITKKKIDKCEEKANKDYKPMMINLADQIVGGGVILSTAYLM